MPKIIIPQKELSKIWRWVEMANGEVGGFGEAVQEGYDVQVKKVFLVEQVAGAADVEYTEEALEKLLIQYKDNPEAIRFQWHSHVDMDVFFSATDEECIRKLDNGAWLASIVVNKQHKIKSRIDIYKPFRVSFDVKVQQQYVLSDREIKSIEDEFQRNVTARKELYALPHERYGKSKKSTRYCVVCGDYHEKKQACIFLCEKCGYRHETKEECYYEGDPYLAGDYKTDKNACFFCGANNVRLQQYNEIGTDEQYRICADCAKTYAK